MRALSRRLRLDQSISRVLLMDPDSGALEALPLEALVDVKLGRASKVLRAALTAADDARALVIVVKAAGGEAGEDDGDGGGVGGATRKVSLVADSAQERAHLQSALYWILALAGRVPSMDVESLRFNIPMEIEEEERARQGDMGGDEEPLTGAERLLAARRVPSRRSMGRVPSPAREADDESVTATDTEAEMTDAASVRSVSPAAGGGGGGGEGEVIRI